MTNEEIETRAQRAIDLFKQGYNCSQAVFTACADMYGITDESLALRLSASFGGGMGRMRLVCGAASGMFMCAGLKFGISDMTAPDALTKKKEHYQRIQKMAAQFAEKSGGSIICRELLGLAPKKAPVEADANIALPHTTEYLKKRPCIELVGDAAEIFASMLQST